MIARPEIAIKKADRAQAASHFVPVTMLVTAAIFALAASVTLMLRERAQPQLPATDGGSGLRASLARLHGTWTQARQYRDFAALLVCSVAYQAGISVVVTLAAVYADQALGFEKTETMTPIFIVNIAAAAGAFAWGYVQDLSATARPWPSRWQAGS